MPAFSVTGPLGSEAIDYGVVTADCALAALHKIHVEGLGRGRVRLAGDRLVFVDPAERQLCAGAWQVTLLRQNGSARSVRFEI